MKAKALKKYKKPRKFVDGVQTLNPNVDPTTQYQTNRGGLTAKDTGFNNTQQSLMNRDLTQQQYSDTTNQAKSDLNNVSDSTKGTRAAASSIASAFGPVGMAVGAGIGIAGNFGDSLNKKVADKELAGGKRDYATRGVANVIDPTTNLIQGLGLDGGGMNGSDLVSGLTAGLINLKGSKEDKATDKAVEAKKREDYANNQIAKYGKVDSTQQAVQAKKGLKKICKTGIKKTNTRIIETEGREPVFSPKKADGSRELLYYNPNDPTHKGGGVKAAVVETSKDRIKGILNIPKNSAIVTANNNMNKKAISAYQKGDNKTLEKVINKMPDDNKKKFDDGTNLLDIEGNILPESKNVNSEELVDSILGKQNKVNFNNPTKKLNTSRLSSTGNSLLAAAPSIYNLAKGLGKSEKTNRRYMSSEGFKYQDTSGANRRAANEQYRVESDNIRNASGGSGSTFLANQSLASANRFKNVSDINNQEFAKRLDIQNANIGLRNQQRQTNLGLANQYDDMDLQNKATKNSFIGAGLTGISDLSQNNQLMKNKANADRLRANTLETNNFKYNTEEEKNTFKANGTKKLKGNKSIRYKNK